jgi:hypothetical protein
MRYLIILFFALCCCTKTTDRSRELAIYDTATSPRDTTVFQNNKFPFGCDLLVGYEFPDSLATVFLPEDTVVSELEKKFNQLMACTNNLNTRDGTIALPTIRSSVFIDLGGYERRKFDDSLLNVKNNCKYHLPNIGPYECYYTYNYELPFQNKLSAAYTKDMSWCAQAGNLILYDPLSKNAKILNVFIELMREHSVFERYFFVDAEKSIYIFDTIAQDGLIVIRNRIKIVVLSSGEIEVSKYSTV